MRVLVCVVDAVGGSIANYEQDTKPRLRPSSVRCWRREPLLQRETTESLLQRDKTKRVDRSREGDALTMPIVFFRFS